MEARLRPGATLRDGQGLATADGRALLTLQGDGNLVLYEYFTSGRRAHLWDSATAGHPGTTVHLQDDGDLVVRRADGHVLWDSGTSGAPGAELVLGADGELVLRRADGRTVWSSGTRLSWARVDFDPARHGFPFRDRSTRVVAALPGAGEVRRWCGGLVFAALDHWHAGVAVPRTAATGDPGTVPPDGHWLTEYLRERLLDSLRVGSAARFAEWSVHADRATWLYEGVHRWCTRDELPRLAEGLRAGRPVPLGLVGARSPDAADDNHQVVAYGFEHDRATGRTTVLVHDSTAPGLEVALTSGRDEVGWTASTGERWRGFFVQDYMPRTPPSPARTSADAGTSAASPQPVRAGRPHGDVVRVQHAGPAADPRVRAGRPAVAAPVASSHGAGLLAVP